jgi:seryl-tRNA(Sec) selenium transferase
MRELYGAPQFCASLAHNIRASTIVTPLRLRDSDPPIVARVEEDRVLLDLRTVFPAQDAVIALALAHLA